MADEVLLDWLDDELVQGLLALLNSGGEEARVAGGAVRNALMGQPVADIDIATTMLPDAVSMLLEKAGYKIVPTGIAHGTVTAVAKGRAFEITTLRRDVATDGRHAQVAFGRDWEADAKRRDLTINALYMDADGKVLDRVGGLADIEARVVRFVGDADRRIREDYLRILRFFRFFAWYGQHRPDADGLKACTRLKGGLSHLSAERAWQELSKLLAAPDPSRAILWMRQTGVLSAVLPESEKWGIDALPGLMAAERDEKWPPDPLLRLMAIIPPRVDVIEGMVARLKLPNKVRDRLHAWSNHAVPDARGEPDQFRRLLYRSDVAAITDRLRLAIARQDEHAASYRRLLTEAETWEKPTFPLSGKDLLASGMEAGPQVSKRLTELEEAWMESDFTLSKEALLSLS
ncbi:MAG: CCA tRNA nucleotidyltransferase [Ahrensia sp.]|nr:CCA tRNA nucleotidyltransferase [Ahrensia sp.]